MKVLRRRPRVAVKHKAWENSRLKRQIKEQWERWDSKKKAREGQRASQCVNTALWQKPVPTQPRLVAMKAQEPAVGSPV